MDLIFETVGSQWLKETGSRRNVAPWGLGDRLRERRGKEKAGQATARETKEVCGEEGGRPRQLLTERVSVPA